MGSILSRKEPSDKPGTIQGRTVIFHAGGINGFTTTLAYFPDTQVTIAVLSNVAEAPDVVATLSPLLQ
jgi:hypothetical protein